jgi:G2/mitotic-specific cyclin-B, other
MLDRFIETAKLTKSSYQLTGITALFMACKFQEIYMPSIQTFVHVTKNDVTEEEMIA